jgi:dTDP-4-amino-4,6-dideoxygalactose transaminase
LSIRLSKCSISSEEIKAVENVLKSEYLGMGKEVLKFELSIKNYLKTDMEVVCVNTGTSALQLALSSLGVGYGDEVLVPSLTYVASFQAISATGAIPIACEVDSDSLFIDIGDAENKITHKTKAIMPVHYASASKGMESVYCLAKKFDLRVIEDAAQAFGCKRNNQPIGTEGDVVCFSFDGIKNITAGEGGAILTKDIKLIQKLKDERLLGVQKDSDNRYANKRSWDFDVTHQGFRFHMNNINAAIGIEQLKKIEIFKIKRQTIAKIYVKAFAGLKFIKTLPFDYDEIMPHIFVIKADKRDLLREYLLEFDIECGVHYKPNHLLSKYQATHLPIAEEMYKKILTLPCHVDLTQDEQSFVIAKVIDFFKKES